jgi:hypothetical protein
MLARLTRDLPIGDFTYEPKWDGFRCLAFVDSARIDLRSRHDRPLGRYFPEIVAGFDAVLAERAGPVPAVATGSDRGELPTRANPEARSRPARCRSRRRRTCAMTKLRESGSDQAVELRIDGREIRVTHPTG